MNGMSADTQVVITTPWWKTAVIIVDVALALLAALCVTRFVMLRGRNKKKEVR
jgi:hypothetical protein